jgi:hypothetical protein
VNALNAADLLSSVGSFHHELQFPYHWLHKIRGGNTVVGLERSHGISAKSRADASKTDGLMVFEPLMHGSDSKRAILILAANRQDTRPHFEQL